MISLKWMAKISIWLVCLGGIGDDWPQFLGPNRNGLASETGLNVDWKQKQPEILWQVEMHDGGFSGPSAASQKVFIVDHLDQEGIVRAFDLTAGTQVWMYAFSDRQGENYGFARSTPTYEQGRLYVLSRLGEAFCFDADSGILIWRKHLVLEFGGSLPRWQISGSPVIEGQQLIACVGGKDTVVALDKNNGDLLWKGGNGDPLGYATPVMAKLSGLDQVLVMTGKSLISLKPGDGALLWTYPWPTKYDVNAATPIVLPDHRVFVTSGYRHGCVLIEVNASTVKTVWENENVQAHFSTPIFFENHIYANSDPDHLICLDPSDGSVKWKQEGFQKGGLIIADDHIFALGGKTGDLVVAKADPKGYVEKGRIKPLGGKSWTAPILSEGKLIIRNTKALACLDMR